MGSELKAHQATGHEPMCLESKNYIHHGIFLHVLEVLHIHQQFGNLWLYLA